MSETTFIVCFFLLLNCWQVGLLDCCLYLVVQFLNDDNPKACFSKHLQWPPKSFRLRQAWELLLLYPSLDVWELRLPFQFLLYVDLLKF